MRNAESFELNNEEQTQEKQTQENLQLQPNRRLYASTFVFMKVFILEIFFGGGGLKE